MQAQITKSLHPLWWVVGVAVVLFSAAGIATYMGWTSSSTASDKAAINAPATQTSRAHPAPHPVVAKCVNCGRIESVREVVTRGEGSGLGAVGGAVVGGVVGNQVGGGRGKDLATVAGAVGGAVAGNEIEKRVKSTKSYEIIVRLDDGSSQTFHEMNMPTWRPGERVKVNNGTIQSY